MEYRHLVPYRVLAVDSEPHPACEDVYDNTCVTGIEIEAEGVNNHKYINPHFWDLTRDGSLRNNGLEFVSQPLAGEALRLALDNFQYTQKIAGGYKYSHRTSVHIHIDIRKLDWESLLTFILLYTMFERPLVKWAGPEREENIFCLPLYKAEQPLDFLSSLVDRLRRFDGEHVRCRSFLRQMLRRNGHVKYGAINFEAMEERGTLEFRSLAGTGDTSRILTWINVLQRIRRYAMMNKPEDLYDIMKYVSENGPVKLWEEVIGNEIDVNSLYQNTYEFEDDIMQGARLAQEALYDRLGSHFDFQRHTTLRQFLKAHYDFLKETGQEPFDYRLIKHLNLLTEREKKIYRHNFYKKLGDQAINLKLPAELVSELKVEV